MAKIDAYLRSIERFGATGLLLTSGKSVTLRFPTGERNATQVVAHDALVALVREIVPPPTFAALEAGRAATFAIDSAGTRYVVSISPRAEQWQVAIDVAALVEQSPEATPPPGPPPSPPASAAPSARAPTPWPRAQSPVALTEPERVEPPALAIERTPYEDVRAAAAGPPGALLARLLAWARAHRATELWVTTGAPVMARVDGAWLSAGEQTLDADLVARELGVIAPAPVRAAYLDRGEAAFSTTDEGGRLRVVWARDSAGPRAVLRFLPGEPPTVEQLGIPRAAVAWLRPARGLIVVAGRAGQGKTTTVAALVRELSVAHGVPVCTLEDPIELVHAPSSLVSQREVGAHVASLAAGVRAVLREGVAAIALSRCDDAETATAIGCALDAGHLVILELCAASSSAALAHLVGLLPPESRAREAIAEGLRGVLLQALAPRRDRGGALAAFEVVPGGPALGRVVLEQQWSAVPELLSGQRAAGAVSLDDGLRALIQRGLVTEPA